jgi:hypothetical protein
VTDNQVKKTHVTDESGFAIGAILTIFAEAVKKATGIAPPASLQPTRMANRIRSSRQSDTRGRALVSFREQNITARFEVASAGFILVA